MARISIAPDWARYFDFAAGRVPEVAQRMGTTTSVISRIESGQHRTGTETLRRLAEALDGHAVLRFEFATDGEPERELVAL